MMFDTLLRRLQGLRPTDLTLQEQQERDERRAYARRLVREASEGRAGHLVPLRAEARQR